ncbi:MAG: DUF4325 domain-containing protein [Patescibacteria group bacterium]
MDVKSQIKKLAFEQKTVKSSDFLKSSNVSRQYIARVLKEMVLAGELIKGGSTRKAIYSLPENSLYVNPSLSLKLENTDLEEDKVLDKIKLSLRAYSSLSQEVKRCFDYAFSELLNNAIEHSRSEKIDVNISIKDENLEFSIIDEGVGIFKNIMTKYKLSSEVDAAQDLLKGKTTTAPHAHSGEGIFFSSKVCDLFEIDSHKIILQVNNKLPDIFLRDFSSPIWGTTVKWKTALNSKRLISDIFSQYQKDKDLFEFDLTSVYVHLYTLDTIYISRSQARRLLAGLDKFKKIILDFSKVETIGQGFADEIFRVFKTNNPLIEIEHKNAMPVVESMIKHVE